MIIKKTVNGVVVSEEDTILFTPEWCVIGPMSDPAYNLKDGEELHYFLQSKKTCICGKMSVKAAKAENLS